jgi:hypothetical protein
MKLFHGVMLQALFFSFSVDLNFDLQAFAFELLSQTLVYNKYKRNPGFVLTTKKNSLHTLFYFKFFKKIISCSGN